MVKTYPKQTGFTIIELLLVITIIGILSVLTISLPSTLATGARDSERHDDVASIARRLELAYSAQQIGAPSYPSTTEFLADIASGSRTASRIDIESFKAPKSTSNSSVIAATSTSTTDPAGSGTPSIDQYIYQPLRSNGNLCTSSNSASSESENCVRYYFYYRTEADSTVRQIASSHQQ